MCGIAGAYGTTDLGAITRMSAAITHRGPDDSGEWRSDDRRVGLVHRRLSVIDVSSLGHQPMLDVSGSTVIVFNGEIYNFRELRAQREAAGDRFRSRSDTEVLLSLYRAYGEGMLDRLNGIFAFAIYDSSDHALFIACDAMGVKPLYFSDNGGRFFFASELKALIAGGVTGTLDVPALYRYVGFLWSPGGTTPLKGVSRLGPGEALRVNDGRIIRRWRWAKSTWPLTSLSLKESEAIGRVQSFLRTAVHRQLIADVPVGAFLSGGLDSSAIVAMAREATPDIECFTIDVGGSRDAGMVDDLPYARRVAAHLGVRLHEIRVDSARMAADLERMVYQLDEPLGDPAPLNVLYISQLAREYGVKVLLSGVGGDDLFTGYRRHRALTLERHWAWLPRTARTALRRSTARLVSYGGTGRRMARAFATADWPSHQRLLGYFLWADPLRMRELFAVEHHRALASEDILAPLNEFLNGLPRELPQLHRMLALEQRFFLADHNLLYTDKMSMAVGVEVRVPFLDNDLVQLANSLPPEMKQRGPIGKWILKKAVEQILPHDVVHRPKSGFGVPLRHWMRYELRDLVRDVLSEISLRDRGIFDPVVVQKLIAENDAGLGDHAYTLLSLLCIEIWCRRFLPAGA